MTRLDKYLCDAEIGTRKEAKALIKAGKVKADGEIIRSADFKFDENKTTITVGEKILTLEKFTYIVMNKPAGVVCAAKDSRDKTIFDVLPQSLKRKGLFTVGRLDKDTVGLIIITNDGELSHRLTSPTKHVEKEYYLEGEGNLAPNAAELFKAGLSLGKLKLKPAELNIISSDGKTAKAKLTISEGKFHQVKRMMYEAGITVTYLKRIRFGSLTLPQDLKEGKARHLTESELSLIKS